LTVLPSATRIGMPVKRMGIFLFKAMATLIVGLLPVINMVLLFVSAALQSIR